MDNKNLVENFWNFKHTNDDKDSLSGCGYDETIEFLKLNDFIKENINVLEVGVGLGYVTKGLFEQNIKVSAIDISDIALQRVEEYCENIYSLNDLEKLPTDYFDIIICNNVIQHVPSDILYTELREFMRSLKPNGMFAVEFVSSDSFEDNGMNPIYEDVIAGRLCRTPRFIETLIDDFGGECSLVFDNKIQVGFLTGHHVFHITK